MLRKRRSLRSKRCYTVLYSTVQYSTVQYSTVQYSTVQYSTVQYSTVQYSTVLYCTVLYCGVRHRTHLQIYILWPKLDRTLDALYRK